MASVYNKVRDHSAALRSGLCETLVFLAVNGNTLFQERLGLDLDAHVSKIIERLLTPLTLDRLQSQERDLPRYAEAAPDTFLSLLERDLVSSEPVTWGCSDPSKRVCLAVACGQDCSGRLKTWHGLRALCRA